MIAWTMVIVATAIALVIAAIAIFQDHLLYFPASASVKEMVTEDLTAWPDVQDFRGLLAEPATPAGHRATNTTAATGSEAAAIRGTVIVFHGNAGHAGHRAFYAPVLTAQGFRVILAEYPAYGPRTGKVDERSLVGDAEQTITLAHRRYGQPLLLIGESLGSAVAAAAAARQADKIAGVLLITPWDRLAHVASHHYPWLPVRLLLRDRYDSAANLTRVDKPVIIVVAQDDSIVPARFGVALYEGLAGPRKLVVIERAGHNDWFDRTDAEWWKAAIEALRPGIKSR